MEQPKKQSGKNRIGKVRIGSWTWEDELNLGYTNVPWNLSSRGLRRLDRHSRDRYVWIPPPTWANLLEVLSAASLAL